MDIFLKSQFGIFLIYFIAGLAICILYDMFRAIRKTMKPSDFMTYIEDIIFWICASIFLIYLIFVLTSGELRLYMFIAICLGGILYYFLLSNYFMHISVNILGFFKIILKKVIKIILMPLKLIFKFNKKVKYIICINLKHITKNINKKSKKMKIKKGFSQIL